MTGSAPMHGDSLRAGHVRVGGARAAAAHLGAYAPPLGVLGGEPRCAEGSISHTTFPCASATPILATCPLRSVPEVTNCAKAFGESATITSHAGPLSNSTGHGGPRGPT